MAGEWCEVAIGEIADVIGGSTPSTADPSNFDGSIPWLTPKDLSGAHSRYVSHGERDLSDKGLACCSARLLPPNSVMLSSRAPIGYVAIAANQIATNQGFRSLVLKPGYDHEFLYYWLTYNIEELERHASGSTFKELSGSSLKKIRIRIPSDLTEQRAIAHILGTLDDKIEINRKMNETLEAMARALFKSWFVDFDPVRAKAEGRWKRGQSLPGLPASFIDLFPDSLMESELGEIPRRWATGKVSELCNSIFSGGTPNTQEHSYWDGGVHWLSSGETREKFIVETERQISNTGVINSSTRLAPAFSTVIASAGQGNTRGQTSFLAFDSYINQSVIALVANPYKSSPYHLFFDLERRYEEFRRISDANSSRGSLTTKMLATMGAVLPSIQAIECFNSIVGVMINRIVMKRYESLALAALRDVLLPNLISGELRVKNSKEIIGDLK